MSKKKLKCNHTQFNGLHEDLNNVRADSKVVKVDKQALANLLDDHAILMQLHGNKVEDTE